MEDKYYYGRNPTEPIIANYRNLHKQDTDYVGGFTHVYMLISSAYGSIRSRELARNIRQPATNWMDGTCTCICRVKQL